MLPPKAVEQIVLELVHLDLFGDVEVGFAVGRRRRSAVGHALGVTHLVDDERGQDLVGHIDADDYDRAPILSEINPRRELRGVELVLPTRDHDDLELVPLLLDDLHGSRLATENQPLRHAILVGAQVEVVVAGDERGRGRVARGEFSRARRMRRCHLSTLATNSMGFSLPSSQ